MKRDMNEPAQWRELLHKKDLEIEALHRHYMQMRECHEESIDEHEYKTCKLK